MNQAIEVFILEKWLFGEWKKAMDLEIFYLQGYR